MSKSHVGITQCYYCNKDNAIVLDARLRNIFEKRVGVIDMTPCSECRGFMDNGIICISIENDTTDEEMPNPRRTGGWAVFKNRQCKTYV
jgi:hypothetical protein